MKRKFSDVLVGLFVVAGFGAMLFLALQAGNLASFSTAPTYSVRAQFDNIGGLKARAPVKSAGVVVGRVQSIGFDADSFRASVVLALDKSYPFPKDSSAKILTSGLLGEQYIGLEPGGDLANLGDGDRITLTQSAVVLENLIGQFLYNKSAEAGDK
ncbi:MAG: outer membrane lipid asymmetry maintenance protein MlaD [Burkholderiaceae bacterium]